MELELIYAIMEESKKAAPVADTSQHDEFDGVSIYLDFIDNFEEAFTAVVHAIVEMIFTIMEVLIGQDEEVTD